jgi:acyl-CoA thioester hydrolase
MSVYLSTQKVIKDWIDYNDHMNVSYYLLMFDKYGADTLNNIFKMGEYSAKTTMKSTMIIETHITYNRELRLNDEVDINCIYFNHDDKKLHYKMEMIHKEKKYLASTIEIFAVYVDLKKRKVTGFEDEKIELMDDFIKKNKLNFNEKDLKFSSKLRK